MNGKVTVLIAWFMIVQVKVIEKRDAVLTPSKQIDRLLRPGSMYLNLNPFEVSIHLCGEYCWMF